MRRARQALLSLCLVWAPATHFAMGGYCQRVDRPPPGVTAFCNCVGSIAPQLVAARQCNRGFALRGGWGSETDHDEDVLGRHDSHDAQQVTSHPRLRPSLPPISPSEAPIFAAAAQSVAKAVPVSPALLIALVVMAETLQY